MRKLFKSLSGIFAAGAAMSGSMLDSEGLAGLIVIAILAACIVLSASCAYASMEVER